LTIHLDGLVPLKLLMHQSVELSRVSNMTSALMVPLRLSVAVCWCHLPIKYVQPLSIALSVPTHETKLSGTFSCVINSGGVPSRAGVVLLVQVLRARGHQARGGLPGRNVSLELTSFGHHTISFAGPSVTCALNRNVVYVSSPKKGSQAWLLIKKLQPPFKRVPGQMC
jgi:hypothetical protein